MIRDRANLAVSIERDRPNLWVKHHLADERTDRFISQSIQLLKLERASGPAFAEQREDAVPFPFPVNYVTFVPALRRDRRR